MTVFDFLNAHLLEIGLAGACTALVGIIATAITGALHDWGYRSE